MKFKGLTKLAMSGVALAAVAATLGTSTYAWYVVNPTANVTNVQASTANAGDTSILVSKDGSNFSGKIAFGANDFNGSGVFANNNRAAFVPVRPIEKVDGTAFYTGDVLDADATTSNTSNAYLKFSVWVKAAKAGDVSVKLSATNTTGVDASHTTATLPTQYAYQDVTSSITATNTFTVDAINALRTAVFIDAATTATVYETDKIAYQSNYSADSKYSTLSLGQVNDTTKKTGTATLIDADGVTSTSESLKGAHLYYAQVMTELPVTTTDNVTVTSATNISDVTLAAANTAVKLTFVVWLEGGDDLCFDACGGQTFEFGLQFDAVAGA
jgi:hypothetical protein